MPIPLEKALKYPACFLHASKHQRTGYLDTETYNIFGSKRIASAKWRCRKHRLSAILRHFKNHLMQADIYIYMYIIYRVIERCGFGYLSKVLHLPSPSNMLGQPMCEGDSWRSWLQLVLGGQSRPERTPSQAFHSMPFTLPKN